MTQKYYARIGGKSQPIGHQFVTDIIGRSQFPKMAMTCRIVSKEKGTAYGNCDSLKFVCQNVGKVYANYVSGYIYVPVELSIYENDTEIFRDGRQFYRIWFDNTHKDTVGYALSNQGNSRPFTISRYDPVLPKLGFRAAEVELSLAIDDLLTFERKIFWGNLC